MIVVGLMIAAMGLLAWLLPAPSPVAREVAAPSAPRPARAGTLDLARLVERLATVLATGASLRGAWAAVARSLPPGDLADLARAAAAGADPRRSAPGALRGSAPVASLGAALTVCERTGAPTAAVLRSLAEALRDLHDAASSRRTAFAGPRSTARILLVLPLAGLGLGMLLGGDPLRLLATTAAGRVLLVLGVLLTAAGWWWMRRLLQRADPARSTGVDPSVLLELVAGALGAGLPLAQSCAAVAEALTESPERQALSRLATALRAGIPVDLAARALPPALAPLGESAALAEASGADLAPVLRSAARDARRGQARAAQERAARLGVTLVVPTGVTLLPAFVVLGIVPTVMSLLGGTVGLSGEAL